MTEHPDLSSGGAGSGTASPGSMLRKLREAAGLSLGTVGQSLHLTVHYVKALENDEYGKLPGLTFVKGYLRSYARFLKTDVDAVLASFDQHIATLVDAGIRTGAVQRSRRRHDQALRWAVAAGVIVVAGLAGGWWYTRQNDNATTVAVSIPAPDRPVVQEQAPVAVPAATAPPAPATLVTKEASAVSVGTFVTLEAAGTAASTAPPAGQKTGPGAFAASDLLSAAGLPAAGTLVAETAPVAAPGATPAVTAIPPPDVAGTQAPDPAAPADAAVAAPAADTAADTGGNDNLSVVPGAGGIRLLTLAGEGSDLLQLDFNGSSWVEIDDGGSVRLYNAMQRAGDRLTVQGEAPFHVLLGDARQVQVRLNAERVDIAADVRPDSTARLVLGEADAAPSGVSN